jgi:hypothetical protein
VAQSGSWHKRKIEAYLGLSGADHVVYELADAATRRTLESGYASATSEIVLAGRAATDVRHKTVTSQMFVSLARLARRSLFAIQGDRIRIGYPSIKEIDSLCRTLDPSRPSLS